ncbi:MAG: aspartate dehydrogenase [Lachnospiraceae bacterium]|nr:aspartate dehydrogenase [Lachnospiraceae bacterium]
MFGRKKKVPKNYDVQNQKPVLRCSICNGEQVAGFKDLRTGKFEEICLIRTPKELEAFLAEYGLDAIEKEY